MHSRLTPLDASFLRVETPAAHMHIGWSSLLEPPKNRPRPSLEALRESIASRLEKLPRFRQRLRFAPMMLGEPFWVDDPNFDVASHVVGLTGPDEAVTAKSFGELRDAVFSEPLDRSRPLWCLYLVPRLEDDRIGLVGKLHHAMVDGVSAVELGILLLDPEPDTAPLPAPPAWRPAPEPGPRELAGEAIADDASAALRLTGDAARLSMRPASAAVDATRTLRRVVDSLRRDLLTAAPPSEMNVPISPQRTVVCHRQPLRELMRVKEIAGVSLNDVCLAVVAGALRELAILHGEPPRPLKVMVPVNVRADGTAGDLGNRVAFVFVELPVHVGSPGLRLMRINQETRAFKDSERPAGAEAVVRALGFLPDPIKDRVAKFAGSARVYNLTVSNIPGPRAPVYMLGARLAESYPVVPCSEDHALSIGMFSYRDHVCFGLYADPVALPQVELLPEALRNSMRALDKAYAAPWLGAQPRRGHPGQRTGRFRRGQAHPTGRSWPRAPSLT
jgi:diacylglycerol O-acyltransferase / wax synthase